MTTDAEAEAFLDQNLSALDFGQFRPLTWEAEPNTARASTCVCRSLLIDALKARAAERGIPTCA